MKWIYLTLMAFLVACTTSVVDSTPEMEEEKAMEEIQEADEVPDFQETTKEDSSDLVNLKEEVKLSDGIKVLPTNKKAGFGDEVSFAMAATNPTNKNFSVMREITFKEARDVSSNTIFAEKAQMMTWLVSVPIRTFDVPAGDVTYDELKFKVGDKISADEAVKPGTYIFVITLYEGETISWDQPRVYDKQEISIRVN